MVIEGAKSLKGILHVPQDKSIFHRALIFGSLGEGVTTIGNVDYGKDVLATINALKALGVNIVKRNNMITVKGKGLYGYRTPLKPIMAANSGTTARLLCGLLAGQNFSTTIIGDNSLNNRPMERVIKPLKLMGGDFELSEKLTLPVKINGARLKGIDYKMEVASAQVKSAIILAAQFCYEKTTILEKDATRDHTEIMLKSFGGDITTKMKKDSLNSCDIKQIIVNPTDKLHSLDVTLPGDISAAAFFIVAGLIIPNSEITIKGVGLNPTRTGIIDVLMEMGADIKIENVQSHGELCGDVIVRSSNLKGVSINAEIIPRLIDEVPILAVAAAFAEGETFIDQVGELRIKESNRLENLVFEMKKTGLDISVLGNGIKIKGHTIDKFSNIKFLSYGDHRMAMAFSVLGFAMNGKNEILGEDYVAVSYPNFYRDFERIRANGN